MCFVDLKKGIIGRHLLYSICKNRPLRICLMLVLCSAVDGLDAISTPINMGQRSLFSKFTKVEFQKTYKGFVRCSNLIFRGIFGNSKDFVGFHDWSKGLRETSMQDSKNRKWATQVFWGFDSFQVGPFVVEHQKKPNMRPLV